MWTRREMLGLLGSGASAAALSPFLGACGAEQRGESLAPAATVELSRSELEEAFAIAAMHVEAPFLWARKRRQRRAWRDSREGALDHRAHHCLVLGGQREGVRRELRLTNPAPGELIALARGLSGDVPSLAGATAHELPRLVRTTSNRGRTSDGKLAELSGRLFERSQELGASQIIYRSVFVSDEEDECLFINRERYLRQRTGRSRAGVLMCAWTGSELAYELGERGRVSSFGEDETLPLDGAEIDAVAKGALAQLHARACSPGHYDLLFAPGACAQLLYELLSQGLCSEEAGGIEPPWSGALLPEFLTLRDDPMVEDGFGSFQRDERGALAAPRTLIQNGLLASEEVGHWLRDETGARRRSLANLVMATGSNSMEELVAMSERGLLLSRAHQVELDPLGHRIRLVVPRAQELVGGRITGRVYGPLVVHAPVADLLASARGATRDGERLSFSRHGLPTTVLARALLTRGEVAAHDSL